MQAQQIADPAWVSRRECALFPHQLPGVSTHPGREAVQPAGRRNHSYILTLVWTVRCESSSPWIISFDQIKNVANCN